MDVTSVPDLVEALRAAEADLGGSLLWCRGHSNSEWTLVPGAFRRHPVLEAELARRFRLQAPARSSRCPSADDLGGWLSLMQHYGVPTRLLDWSESPLVAAYFALLHEKGQGASTVWLLEPGRLNEVVNGSREIPTLEHPEIRPIVSAAFERDAAVARTSAVTTTHSDARMVAQLAHYTLHGGDTPLEQHDEQDRFLRKLTIPEGSRDRVTSDLTLLGIRRSILFPDLQGLAKELRDYVAIE